MSRLFMRITLCAVAIVALAAVLSGCGSKQPAAVVAVWPQASVEATVTGPANIPTWPLTGLPAPSKAATKKRPLSIKIENSPTARPQTGLNSADVVYETVTEGGITRFHCVFHSDVPKIVGPVRSARLSDMWIVPQYHGIFFFSGSSSSVAAAIRRANLPNMSQDVGISVPYFRSSARPAPHNLYLNTTKAYTEAAKHHIAVTADVPALDFGPVSSLTSATPVKSVYVPNSSFNNVTWTYSAKRGVWLRKNNGVVHRDAATGKQVAAKNVVVMWARYTPASHDMVGSTTYDIRLGGKGRAAVFRDGVYVDGSWIASRNHPPHFVDVAGRPVKLARGNTWFEVVPLSVNISMK